MSSVLSLPLKGYVIISKGRILDSKECIGSLNALYRGLISVGNLGLGSIGNDLVVEVENPDVIEWVTGRRFPEEESLRKDLEKVDGVLNNLDCIVSFVLKNKLTTDSLIQPAKKVEVLAGDFMLPEE